jgi:exodeoxyribonuclease V alpha subunit
MAGHVCVALPELAGTPIGAAEDPGEDPPRWPALEAWREALWASGAVGDGTRPTPLVLDAAGRLYLARYWRYEDDLARRLHARARTRAPAVDESLLTAGLERLFGPPPRGETTDHQRLAAATAVLRRLAVISGGPGTGKTTTVVRILTLLEEQARAAGQPPPRVRLAAPTGKAAARLSESVRDALTHTGATFDEAGLPREASTIHRLLRTRWDAPNRFVHDRENPLPADVVVIDETSMVDLALLSKLVAAVPDRARLILLGDRDQLASVEAGAVLGDICNTGRPVYRSAGFAADLARVTGQEVPGHQTAEVPSAGLGDCVVQLTRSYRFGPDSGIGRLAAAVNGGHTDEALGLLRDPEVTDVSLQVAADEAAIDRIVAPHLGRGYGPYLAAPDPAARLAALGRYRVLCAHRRGPGGVESLNALAEAGFERAGALRPGSEWYPGRPVLVSANDYPLGLFNGDVGVIVATPTGGTEAVFADADGGTRALAPSRLPRHETVFATTVHRSQGSEVDEVLVVLPLRPSPVATRELLYTAITRARKAVTICASTASVEGAVGRRCPRASGLRDRLWG